MAIQAIEITVRGVVQGVGFRPFVHRIARACGLSGWVTNTPGAVVLRVEGEPGSLSRFRALLKEETPPAARMTRLSVRTVPPSGARAFEIRESRTEGIALSTIPPDIATCPACLEELYDPGDRRYRYPFTNCTNCGPRFTIVSSLPYDRERTSMSAFPMCAACREEYGTPRTAGSTPAERLPCMRPPAIAARRRRRSDPGGRPRRHGGGGTRAGKDRRDPGVGRFSTRRGRDERGRGARAARTEAEGREAVRGDVSRHRCRPDRRESLEGRRGDPADAVRTDPALPRPRRLPPGPGGLDGASDGGRFPPVHAAAPPPAVARGSPAGDDQREPDRRADRHRERRGGDAAARNRRPVPAPRPGGAPAVGRFRGAPRGAGGLPDPAGPRLRSRPGVAPAGVPGRGRAGRGPEGDLLLHPGGRGVPVAAPGRPRAVADARVLRGVVPVLHGIPGRETARGVPRHASRLFHDVFRLPARRGRPASRPPAPQGAHVLRDGRDRLLREGGGGGVRRDRVRGGRHDLGRRVLPGGRGRSVARRPPGPVPAPRRGRRRPGALANRPLPDAEVLGRADAEKTARVLFPDVPVASIALLLDALDRGLNVVPTSSAGRLFDAAAAIAGICARSSFEGQAPMRLEAAASRGPSGLYPFSLFRENGLLAVNWMELVAGMVSDAKEGVPAGRISRRFHDTLAAAILEAVSALADACGARHAILSGGVFQNATLLGRVLSGLRRKRLTPLIHRQVPTNDGGISLGQAYYAALRVAGR